MIRSVLGALLESNAGTAFTGWCVAETDVFVVVSASAFLEGAKSQPPNCRFRSNRLAVARFANGGLKGERREPSSDIQEVWSGLRGRRQYLEGGRCHVCLLFKNVSSRVAVGRVRHCFAVVIRDLKRHSNSRSRSRPWLQRGCDAGSALERRRALA